MTKLDVAERDAASDRDWFTENPARRYRLRAAGDVGWLIRRRAGGVLLRTPIAHPPRHIPDRDAALRETWFEAAMPFLSPIERAALVKQVKKSEKLHEL